MKHMLRIIICVFAFCMCYTEKSYAYYAGWEDFERKWDSETLPLRMSPCFSGGEHFLKDIGELGNNDMVYYYSDRKDYKSHKGDFHKNLQKKIIIMTAVIASTGIVGVIAMTAYILIEMEDVCRGMFVFQPHEYYAFRNWERDGGYCKLGGNGFIYNKHKQYRDATNSGDVNEPITDIRTQAIPPTKNDIPYFYHCDDRIDYALDPAGNPCIIGDASCPLSTQMKGKSYGHGNWSGQCQRNANPYSVSNITLDSDVQKGKLIGAIVVGYINSFEAWKKRWLCPINSPVIGGCEWDLCDGWHMGSIQQKIMRIDAEDIKMGGHEIVTFLRMDTNNQIKMCAAVISTFVPIVVGCAPIAPPADEPPNNTAILERVEGTRCLYLTDKRGDLAYLADKYPDMGGALKKFLRSDFHPLSTIVGCIDDMLLNLFSKDWTVSNYQAESNNSQYEAPFTTIDKELKTVTYHGPFAKIQEKFKGIVTACLTLYVCLFGIKILLAMGQIEKKDYIIALLKFGVVVYFTIGTGVQDIYPAILNSPRELSAIFIKTFGSNDPRQHCYYNMDDAKSANNNTCTADRLADKDTNKILTVITPDATMRSSECLNADYYNADTNLLGERIISIPVAQSDEIDYSTIGFNNEIKITIWDLFDCKLINYLNLGTCNYSFASLIIIYFLAGPVMIITGMGFIILIMTALYAYIALEMMLKFAHIAIISAFAVALLIFVSPIFFCFLLFERTKGMFDTWKAMIIGYIIYPALPFAYAALVFATIDVVYYGNVDLSKMRGAPTEAIMKDACYNVDSIFCQIIINYEGSVSLCDAPENYMSKNVLSNESLSFLGNTWSYAAPKTETMNLLFKSLGKMLFLFLFFKLLTESVLEFLARLIKVVPVSAKGGEDWMNTFSKMNPAKIGSTLLSDLKNSALGKKLTPSRGAKGK